MIWNNNSSPCKKLPNLREQVHQCSFNKQKCVQTALLA